MTLRDRPVDRKGQHHSACDVATDLTRSTESSKVTYAFSVSTSLPVWMVHCAMVYTAAPDCRWVQPQGRTRRAAVPLRLMRCPTASLLSCLMGFDHADGLHPTATCADRCESGVAFALCDPFIQPRERRRFQRLRRDDQQSALAHSNSAITSLCELLHQMLAAFFLTDADEVLRACFSAREKAVAAPTCTAYGHRLRSWVQAGQGDEIPVAPSSR